MKYGVILADPPWTFKTYSAAGTGRSAISHYDVMSIDDIKSMNVESSAAADCVLFLWTTDPMLPIALEVIDSWGFIYKTVGFYWAKTLYSCTDDEPLLPGHFPIGTGYWTRANPEQCLLATRGHPKRQNADVRKLIVSPRREHSRKPDEIYDRIERLCAGPYLEMFARSTRPGWDSLGNQTMLFDGAADRISTRRQPSSLAPRHPLDGPI